MSKSRSTAQWTVMLLVALMPLSMSDHALGARNLSYDVSGDFTYDDNVARSEADADIESDFIFSLRTGISYLQQINAISNVVWRAQLRANAFNEFDDQNNAGIALSGAYSIQPSPGYTAPWLTFSLEYLERRYDASPLRDGGTLTATAAVTKRLTDRLRGRLFYRFENRSGDDDPNNPNLPKNSDNVYDLQAHNLSFNLNYTLRDPLVFYFAATYRDGDVVSNATPDPRILSAASQRAFDDSFGRGSGNRRRVSYRLDGETVTLNLGTNIAINRHAAIDISTRYYDVAAKGDNNYDGLIVNAGLLFRFK